MTLIETQENQDKNIYIRKNRSLDYRITVDTSKNEIQNSYADLSKLWSFT